MLSKRAPGQALALTLLMFSLMGLPPLVGFFGKMYVLNAAVQANLAWLAVAGVIASVIAAFYYLRIIYYIWFGDETDAIDGKIPLLHLAFLSASAGAMVFGIVNMFGVEGMALAAATSLLN